MLLKNLFKRKKSATRPLSSLPTFKENVSEFWTWYAANADRLYQAIEHEKAGSLVNDVSKAVDKWLNGMAWVFGPGPDNQGHSFTVSPEGDEHRYFLAEHWRSLAPELPGWTFYSSRQPGEGSLAKQSISIGGDTFKPEEFWITPEPDIENERIHITAWHPLFAKLPQNDQYSILFLWLDEVLGERGTADFIGKIDLGNGKLRDSIPILEFGAYVREHGERNQWKGREPGKFFTGYSRDNPSDDFPRADIFTGTTSHMALIDDHFEAQGKMEDPLAGFGAAYLFLAFDRAFLPKGKEVDLRCEIEDAISDALTRNQSGLTLGGATGTRNAYIDLLVFDGERSVQLIADAVRPFNLPSGSALYPFAGRADVPVHVF